MSFATPSWLPSHEIKKALAEIPSHEFGDLYIRCIDKSGMNRHARESYAPLVDIKPIASSQFPLRPTYKLRQYETAPARRPRSLRRDEIDGIQAEGIILCRGVLADGRDTEAMISGREVVAVPNSRKPAGQTRPE